MKKSLTKLVMVFALMVAGFVGLQIDKASAHTASDIFLYINNDSPSSRANYAVYNLYVSSDLSMAATTTFSYMDDFGVWREYDRKTTYSATSHSGVTYVPVAAIGGYIKMTTTNAGHSITAYLDLPNG